jgi:[FeFe] hydrogenase H-cluster maturation GTPase HydF
MTTPPPPRSDKPRRRRVFRGFRLHIGLFGRRNVGKSSLLNAITRQDVSIVSPQAGTTTDPVNKPMELLPLGPVLFIDTAGIDDVGALGEARVAKTRRAIERTDLAVLVTEAGTWGDFEEQLLVAFAELQTPVVIVENKIDLEQQAADPPSREHPVIRTAATTGVGLGALREALLAAAPESFLDNPAIIADLVGPGELAILVVPIDKEAPKGRLILPQVQAIRDLLDGDAMALVVKERELRSALERLAVPPKLVVTDSQAFLKVAADTPPEIPLTSFSVLFSRFKGELLTQVGGALAIERLRAGDRVLIAEACTHHPIAEDIGRVKIPRWLTQYVGGKLQIDTVAGRDWPDDVSPYRLVVHCGACMFNRRAMLSRLLRCRQAGVPVTNYGLAIAYSLGIFERALGPFPAARELYRAQLGQAQ